MLQFFRKLRQKLLTENKFSKYLLYVIGEIFLVVIGILIALQINNWNEARKGKIKEIHYLFLLKDEFEANLRQTETNHSQMKKYRSLTELALMVYSEDTIVDPRLLAVAIEFSSYGGPPNIKDNVWQDLVSSGNINLISNAQLRTAISEYLSMAAMHRNFHKENWVDDQNDTHNITSTVLSWKDRNSVSESFGSFLRDSTFRLPEISIDFETIREKIRDLAAFESKLQTMYQINRIHMVLDENEINAIKDILRMLDEDVIRLNQGR
jgi:hypothetical protein